MLAHFLFAAGKSCGARLRMTTTTIKASALMALTAPPAMQKKLACKPFIPPLRNAWSGIPHCSFKGYQEGFLSKGLVGQNSPRNSKKVKRFLARTHISVASNLITPESSELIVQQNGKAGSTISRRRKKSQEIEKADLKLGRADNSLEEELPSNDALRKVEGVETDVEKVLDTFLIPDKDPIPPKLYPDAMVLGVDPDVSGALAVLRGSFEETAAQVLDVPFFKVKIGSTMRRRHDPGAMSALIRSLEPPPGTVVYIEQPRPVPLDGKQGWYSAGYGFGVWMGLLHALELTVVPVHPANWKRALGIAGRGFNKDDSRELALRFFPALAKELKRKKDHGRAEALLIAQHGRMLAANMEPLQPFVRAADTSEQAASRPPEASAR